jgi:hypothetical protein
MIPFLPLQDQGDRFSDGDDVNLTPRAHIMFEARRMG